MLKPARLFTLGGTVTEYAELTAEIKCRILTRLELLEKHTLEEDSKELRGHPNASLDIIVRIFKAEVFETTPRGCVA